MSDKYIGPVLPPHLRENSSDEDSEERDIGPSLPPNLGINTSSGDADCIGPALPSGLSVKDSQFRDISQGPTVSSASRKRTSSDSDDDDEKDTIGPAMPPGFKKARTETSSEHLVGPVLPAHLQKEEEEESDDPDAFGPALPPGLHIKTTASEEEAAHHPIGPVLPPHLQKAQESDESDSFGVALPPGFQKESVQNDLSVIGPLPTEMMTGDARASAAAEFEERARRMKDKLTDKPVEQPKQRESWMTELPTGMKKDLGLTARTFSRRTMPDKDRDTSSWTDTPADKARKEREKAEHHKSSHRASDKSTSSSKDRESKKYVDKHNKSKRAESLLEIHQKDRKKKKKKDKDKPKERLAFDRERDLQVNKFDDAQRRSIIKKSQQLNSRFSNAGSTSSFL